jgi:hypothetical protein
VNGAPVTLSPGLVTGDPDSALLAGATVAISGGTFTGDGDFLTAITNGTSIAAAYNQATETLTLSGSDTLANYQQVLRTVAFGSTNANPGDGQVFPTRTITWVLSDAVASSAQVKSTVTLFNTAPPLANHAKILAVQGAWILLFTGTADQGYVVQTAPSVSGPWSDLSSVLTANASGLVSYEDLIQPTIQTRFYRVRPDF